MHVSVLESSGPARAQTLYISRAHARTRAPRTRIHAKYARKTAFPGETRSYACDRASSARSWGNPPTTPSYERCTWQPAARTWLLERAAAERLRRDETFCEKGARTTAIRIDIAVAFQEQRCFGSQRCFGKCILMIANAKLWAGYVPAYNGHGYRSREGTDMRCRVSVPNHTPLPPQVPNPLPPPLLLHLNSVT